MIGHIETGEDFSGLFHYLLNPNKKPRVIGGNAAGETVGQLSDEFSQCAQQRRSTHKPVKHLSIAFAPSDGEVSDEIKNEIADAVVEGLGYINNQYAVIDHNRNDPGHDWTHDHDHIHIAVNAIGIDGKRVNDHQDKRRMEALLRQQEIACNLTRIPSSWEKSRRSPTHGQVQRYKKEKREYEEGKRSEPPKIIVSEYLQDAIAAASADKPTVSEFISRLQERGVEVYPRLIKGRTLPQGFSYTYDGVKIPGYKLGCASFRKLLNERGLRFSPKRDIPVLEEAKARSIKAMTAYDRTAAANPISSPVEAESEPTRMATSANPAVTSTTTTNSNNPPSLTSQPKTGKTREQAASNTNTEPLSPPPLTPEYSQQILEIASQPPQQPKRKKKKQMER